MPIKEEMIRLKAIRRPEACKKCRKNGRLQLSVVSISCHLHCCSPMQMTASENCENAHAVAYMPEDHAESHNVHPGEENDFVFKPKYIILWQIRQDRI